MFGPVKRHLAPVIRQLKFQAGKALRQTARQMIYYGTINPTLLAAAVIDRSSRPLPGKIADLEQQYIERQGVTLDPHGKIIAETRSFLAQLKNGQATEVDAALTAALADIDALEHFTPEEIHALFVAFHHYLDLGKLGQPITKITKQARIQLIQRLNQLRREIQTSASFVEKETLLKQINLLLSQLALATINNKTGEIDFYDDLSYLFRACFCLGHEAGHPLFERMGISWPAVTPLTFSRFYYKESQQAEEDFCENFSFYLNGYLAFYFLATISPEWAKKFAILQKISPPNTYLINPAFLWYFYQHSIIQAEKHLPTLKGLSKAADQHETGSFLLSLFLPRPAYEPDIDQQNTNAFIKIARDQGSLDMEVHRRVIGALIEQGQYNELKTIQYKGMALEEYGVQPYVLKLIELLGEIPVAVQKALDKNQGASIFIGFAKLEDFPFYIVNIITQNGIHYDPITSFSNVDPAFFSILSKEVKDLPPPRSTLTVTESKQAAKQPAAEREYYYKQFEKQFGIKLAGSEHREFSAMEVASLTDRLNSIPPTMRKLIKTIQRISSGEGEAQSSYFSNGVFHIDDFLSIFLSHHEHFFFAFCRIFANPLFSHLVSTKNKAFARFLGSGSWVKETNTAKEQLAHCLHRVPYRPVYIKTSEERLFLRLEEKNPVADLESFLYFSLARPELLAEICARYPIIGHRLKIFEQI